MEQQTETRENQTVRTQYAVHTGVTITEVSRNEYGKVEGKWKIFRGPAWTVLLDEERGEWTLL